MTIIVDFVDKFEFEANVIQKLVKFKSMSLLARRSLVILRLEVLNDFQIGMRARLVFFELTKFGFVGRARQVRLLSFVL